MQEKHDKRINADDHGREGAPDSPREPRYDLARLVAGVTREQVHTEVDWGEARGEEAW